MVTRDMVRRVRDLVRATITPMARVRWVLECQWFEVLTPGWVGQLRMEFVIAFGLDECVAELAPLMRAGHDLGDEDSER